MVEAATLIILAIFITFLTILFGGRFKDHLSVRIALLILATAPLVLIALLLFNAMYSGSFGRPAPWWLRILQVLTVILGMPLLMGLLASRYVTRPLKDFTDAIQSLKDNNYNLELQRTDIVEFNTVFAEFNDLTKRLHKEEELRKNLISDTSHELNTPLMAIMSQLSAVEDNVLPMDAARVRHLKAQVKRLQELIQRLDAYTKARTLAATSQKTEVRLRDHCNKLQAAFEALLEERGMRLVVDVPSSLTVEATPASIDQILTNLVQNAIRYSGGNMVTVQATKQYLTVSDNGMGVPEESLPYLFDRFYRVDASRSRVTGGMGIGLAIVEELVNGLGWHIKAELAHPGLRMVISF